MTYIERTGRRTLVLMALWGLIGLVAISLGGCFANSPGQGEFLASPAELAAKDDAICQSYGAKPGSAEYINCRGQQDQRRTTFRASQ
jgi:hypothetical protein